jgi:protein-tyrosine phosphatase
MSARCILFVCLGNTCRSPMAAALANQMPGVTAESAGVIDASGYPAAPDACALLAGRGIDLGAHRSRSISTLDLAAFDAIVALEPSVAAHIETAYGDGLQLVTWDIADPAGRGQVAYEQALDSIESELNKMMEAR